MAYNLPRVKIELKLALSAIYGIRMHTPHDRWTPYQVELITRIESDIVKLRDSIKGGWSND